MNPTTKSPAVDPRTPSQKEADDAAAAGNWEGFETEVLLTEEGAHRLLDHCRDLAQETGAGRQVTREALRDQPFRWRENVFHILRCEYIGGQALVEVAPPDHELVAEIKRRLEQDRFHSLSYCQGFGFICFPEDYQRYQ